MCFIRVRQVHGACEGFPTTSNDPNENYKCTQCQLGPRTNLNETTVNQFHEKYRAVLKRLQQEFQQPQRLTRKSSKGGHNAVAATSKSKKVLKQELLLKKAEETYKQASRLKVALLGIQGGGKTTIIGTHLLL